MRNCPSGSLVFKSARATGWIEVAGGAVGDNRGRNVLSRFCCDRSLLRPGAIKTLEVRLFGDAPLCSRVPWYELKKNNLFTLMGPPSNPPKTLRRSAGRATPAAFKNGLLALSASWRKYS